MPLWAWVISGAMFASGLPLLVFALWGDRSRGRRRCPRCWYDMSGADSLKCPECGREARSESRLFRTRRRWSWAALAALLLIGTATAPLAGDLAARGWKAVPTPVLIWLAPWISLDPSGPGGSILPYPRAFAEAVQKHLPRWEQRLLACRLTRCLKSPDPKQRGIGAAYVWASFDNGRNELLAQCVPALVAAVNDPDADAAYGIANALAGLRLADQEFGPLWLSLLVHSPHEHVRAEAASCLGWLARKGDQDVTIPLLRAVIDPSPEVRQQVVYALGATRDPAIVPALIVAACQKDYGASGTACHALEKLEDAAAPAVPALLGIVRNKRNESWGWAVIALGRIGPGAAEAVPDLVKGVDNTAGSARGREECAIALGRIGDANPEVVGAVRAALEDIRVPVQRGCLEALYRLSWTPEGADRAMLEAFVVGTDPVSQIWARMIMARAEDTLDGQVSDLMALLEGQPWYVSQAAIYALDSMGARSGRALSALKALCPPPGTRAKDGDADLKQQAAEPAVRHISAALAHQSTAK